MTQGLFLPERNDKKDLKKNESFEVFAAVS
jgi:hypothetical protein